MLNYFILDNLSVPQANFLGMPELELETVFELEANESMSSSSIQTGENVKPGTT